MILLLLRLCVCYRLCVSISFCFRNRARVEWWRVWRCSSRWFVSPLNERLVDRQDSRLNKRLDFDLNRSLTDSWWRVEGWRYPPYFCFSFCFPFLFLFNLLLFYSVFSFGRLFRDVVLEVMGFGYRLLPIEGKMMQTDGWVGGFFQNSGLLKIGSGSDGWVLYMMMVEGDSEGKGWRVFFSVVEFFLLGSQMVVAVMKVVINW